MHLSACDQAETHEYDTEPPDAARAEQLAKQRAKFRNGSFRNRREANAFYEREYAWLEDFHANRAAKETG